MAWVCEINGWGLSFFLNFLRNLISSNTWYKMTIKYVYLILIVIYCKYRWNECFSNNPSITFNFYSCFIQVYYACLFHAAAFLFTPSPTANVRESLPVRVNLNQELCTRDNCCHRYDLYIIDNIWSHYPTLIYAIQLQWSSHLNGSGLFGQQKGG